MLFKMAGSLSIANELFNLVLDYNYVTEVPHIPLRDVLPQSVFPRTPLAKDYWLDMRHTY